MHQLQVTRIISDDCNDIGVEKARDESRGKSPPSEVTNQYRVVNKDRIQHETEYAFLEELLVVRKPLRSHTFDDYREPQANRYTFMNTQPTNQRHHLHNLCMGGYPEIRLKPGVNE